LEFRILGPVGFWREGYEAPLKGSKQKTLLAALLLAKGRMLTDSQLSDVLWGDEAPGTYQAQIYTYASRLRRHLNSNIWIVRQGPGYLLKIGSAQFDYNEFTQRSRAGRAALAEGRFDKAATLLHSALSLWRGPTLTDVTELLGESERPRIEEERMDTVENRIDAELALGQHDRLTSELIGLVGTHPLRERMRAQLMAALYRSDRQAEAFATYQEGCRLLADELGVDPGPKLKRTYQAILTGELKNGQQPGIETGSAVTFASPLTSTPPTATPDFTGRAAELAATGAAVSGLRSVGYGQRRIITVLGMTGIGKTAFALHVADRFGAEFPDGVLFLDLQGGTPDPVPPHEAISKLLELLGVRTQLLPANLEQRIQLYRGMIAQRRVLVVLDDAAHERQVRPLTTGSSHSQLIVTSRAQLPTLEGQFIVRLASLDSGESLALLTEIVGAARVAAEPVAAQRIVDYCAGFPLAVRIVGARLAAKQHWPLSRLAERLADKHDRLDELKLGELDVRASLDRTYRVLGEEAGTALLRLAMLDTRSLSKGVIEDALGLTETSSERLTEELLDLHLLTHEGLDHAGRDSYGIHSLIRLHAQERAKTAGLCRQLESCGIRHTA
jgi:DNA-binding SARP family transcriptional activator